MTTSDQVLSVALAVAGYLVAPILLIRGWLRWAIQPKMRNVISALSPTGFLLATASAILAFSAIVQAQFAHFRYYDPRLMSAIIDLTHPMV
jgi:hypothetical protein